MSANKYIETTKKPYRQQDSPKQRREQENRGREQKGAFKKLYVEEEESDEFTFKEKSRGSSKKFRAVREDEYSSEQDQQVMSEEEYQEPVYVKTVG